MHLRLLNSGSTCSKRLVISRSLRYNFGLVNSRQSIKNYRKHSIGTLFGGILGTIWFDAGQSVITGAILSGAFGIMNSCSEEDMVLKTASRIVDIPY